ncbi:MAG: hypothetical protein OWR52_00120 [Acidibacillus sp.]|nr:hypothetical protein [Acidibacillus sp.]
MIAIHTMMQLLAKKRPIFHSEADFQHSLAWGIHESDPSIEIRLEYPHDIENSRWHLDLWLMRGDERCAVELKYYTTTLQTLLDGESYQLRDHSADDHLRHGFCKDVERLETVNQSTNNCTSYAILLTNSPRLWLPPKSERMTNDSAFLLHDGRNFGGALEWGPNASAGTRKGHEAVIQLNGSYDLMWRDYSSLEGTKNGEFRYLVTQISQELYK